MLGRGRSKAAARDLAVLQGAMGRRGTRTRCERAVAGDNDKADRCISYNYDWRSASGWYLDTAV
ncbi:hypothetical protein GGP41_005638 [Bipolaris sorokiniana]|uniref:Uncharacterized protein n=1 Tax=Cochliobolus sativus TaxID=45130 RepID=A0A8H5ZG88_COCSA|nr:hypothetical protein GGP41_005638 [Bipolaris sorokiniana]